MDSTTRRQLLKIGTSAPFLILPAFRVAVAAEAVDATTLRRPGDASDTDALLRALQSGRPVRLPAGGGSGPSGEYLVDMLDLPSNAWIAGEGHRTIVRSTSARVPNVFRVDGSREITRNITLRDMAIAGHVGNDGFREHHHLVNLSGIDNCLIEGLLFLGFAGDGLYIGGEREGITRVPRNNSNVKIINCVFNGINNDNRNGISVTGGSDITIDHCRFVRCTRPNMPGPIDFEADDFPFYVFNRLSVTNCSFEDCGGNVGQINVITPPSVAQIPRNVVIKGNRFSRYVGTGSDIALIVHRRAAPSMLAMDVVIEQNTGYGGRAGVRAYSGRGIDIRDNVWNGYLGQSFIGYTGPADGCHDVRVADRYESCGRVDGVALGIYNASSVNIEGCSFIDCGGGKAASACILLGPGRSNGVKVAGNDFLRRGSGVVPLRRNAEHHLAGPLVLEPRSLRIDDPLQRR